MCSQAEAWMSHILSEGNIPVSGPMQSKCRNGCLAITLGNMGNSFKQLQNLADGEHLYFFYILNRHCRFRRGGGGVNSA